MLDSVRSASICLFIFSCSTFVAAAPQIFTDVYTFCDFTFSDEKKFTFPNKIWTITKKDFTINFSVCKSVQSKCLNKTSSCLKSRENNQITDLGHEFIPGDSDDYSLISLNGARCPSNPIKNYTLSISLECSDSMKPIPRLLATDDEDECTFQVIMMRPDCRPKCTEVIQGAYLLDIRNFTKNIQLQSDSRKFSLTLCGANNNCRRGISGCELLNDNTVVPLMQTESQHLSYDANKNELTARGRYKQNRVVRDVQVLIKCKWETDLVNARYKKVPTQGRHYKFEVESSFGCVKLPHSCTLSSDNLIYDLSKLYMTNGWEVRGAPNGRILVNICGSLNQLEGVCADQHSQVCHIHNQNYVNRGSILSSLKAHNDFVKAIFVSGSTCEENNDLLYSTEIEFRCSRTEKGPLFKEYRGCVMVLIWETPRACPLDYYTSSNCYMNDRVSNRNLQKLYTESDRVYTLPSEKNTKLIYNICGPLHTSCNNFTNVSFCLKTEQNETVIGWQTKNLISENGLVRMELSGTRGDVIVNFICTYEDPPPATQIVIEDGYKYKLTIFTQSACLSQSTFSDCVYSADNITYDLSPLVYKNKNHVIHDEENIEYIFNLCGPIIGGSEALCRGDTGFCLRNKSEDNIKYRYTSLGGVGKPRLVNNSLVVEAEMGSYCEGLGYYKSVIHFECSEEKMPPTFLTKVGCVYNFKWKTPEACPQKRNCVVKGASDVTIDLNNLQHKSLKFNVDNSTNVYEFHLCNDHYTEYSNDVKSIYPINRDFFTSEYNSFLVLDSRKNCSSNSTITKVIFKIECSQATDDYFEKQSFENCILNMTIHTNLVCNNKKDKQVPYSIIDPDISKEHEERNEIVTLSPRKEKNCTIVNGKTGYEFNLSTIPREELFFSNSTFVINFESYSSQCRALFCKNDNKIIPEKCPVVSFNYTNRYLKLEYSSADKCNSQDFYALEVLLKCNQTTSGGKIVKDEVCRSVISYDLPQACELLKADIISSAPVAAVAGGITSVVVLIIGVLLIIIYLNRRRCPYLQQYIPFHRRDRDKSNVPIYLRNCSE